MKHCKNKDQAPTANVDMVEHPPHYTTGFVECIDAIQASMTQEAFLGYCKGNVLKYVWRAGLKGAAAQDLEKAEWYLNRMLNELGGEK